MPVWTCVKQTVSLCGQDPVEWAHNIAVVVYLFVGWTPQHSAFALYCVLWSYMFECMCVRPRFAFVSMKWEVEKHVSWILKDQLHLYAHWGVSQLCMSVYVRIEFWGAERGEPPETNDLAMCSHLCDWCNILETLTLYEKQAEGNLRTEMSYLGEVCGYWRGGKRNGGERWQSEGKIFWHTPRGGGLLIWFNVALHSPKSWKCQPLPTRFDLTSYCWFQWWINFIEGSKTGVPTDWREVDRGGTRRWGSSWTW